MRRGFYRTLVYNHKHGQERGAAHGSQTCPQYHWYWCASNRLALEEQHRNDMKRPIYRQRPSKHGEETIDRGKHAAHDVRVRCSAWTIWRERRAPHF